MGCFGQRCVYTLHTAGRDGEHLVFVFSSLEKAIEHALNMKWPERKWVLEYPIDRPDEEVSQVWPTAT